jgi:D-threo-aldose 1-dehydrogenase
MARLITTVLPGTLRSTSRIGFGTSGLSGELTRKESIELLETAFDFGIRHFDTAPLYGAGSSEIILGEFLAKKRSSVTLTTKFGLMPPRSRSLLLAAKGIIRPALRRVPGLKSRLALSIRGLNRTGEYSPTSMIESLKSSIRALRCERIDLFLAHEADDVDLTCELRSALDDAATAGLIGAWGIASTRDKVDRAVQRSSITGSILQFEWSVLSDMLPTYDGKLCITHGALSQCFARISKLLAVPERRRQWSDNVGVDFGDPRVLPRLLIGSALSANPTGIVLFSSKKVERIREAATIIQSPIETYIAKFISVVQRDKGELRGDPKDVHRPRADQNVA